MSIFLWSPANFSGCVYCVQFFKQFFPNFKEKLRSQLAEVDPIKRELKLSKQKLEEEQKTRIRIEQQLDQHNEKVMTETETWFVSL